MTDALLGDADAALDIATKAVEKAERILREAQETLKTLKGSVTPSSRCSNYQRSAIHCS